MNCYVSDLETTKTAFKHLVHQVRNFVYSKDGIPLKLQLKCKLQSTKSLQVTWILTKPNSKDPVWKLKQAVILISEKNQSPRFLNENFRPAIEEIISKLTQELDVTVKLQDLVVNHEMKIANHSGVVDSEKEEPSENKHITDFIYADTDNFDEVATRPCIPWEVESKIPKGMDCKVWDSPSFLEKLKSLYQTINGRWTFAASAKSKLSEISESKDSLQPITSCFALVSSTGSDSCTVYFHPLVGDREAEEQLQLNTPSTDNFELKHLRNLSLVAGFQCSGESDSECQLTYQLTDLMVLSKEDVINHDNLEIEVRKVLEEQKPEVPVNEDIRSKRILFQRSEIKPLQARHQSTPILRRENSFPAFPVSGITRESPPTLPRTLSSPGLGASLDPQARISYNYPQQATTYRTSPHPTAYSPGTSTNPFEQITKFNFPPAVPTQMHQKVQNGGVAQIPRRRIKSIF